MTFNVTVVDALMGSGKSTWAINMVRERRSKQMTFFEDQPKNQDHFIFVVPTLSEIDRVKEACPEVDFHDPEPRHGRKFYHLRQLIEEGRSICTTHSLFSRWTPELTDLLKDRRYVLILDEVIDAVSTYSLSGDPKTDLRVLFEQRFVSVEDGPRARLVWNEAEYGGYRDGGKFSEVRDLCRNGNLVLSRDHVLLWSFCPEFLEAFKETFVLTYCWSGSNMSRWLEMGGVSVRLMSMRDFKPVPYSADVEWALRQSLASKIEVYEGRLNRLGERTGKGHPLSAGWFDARARERPASGKKSTLEQLKSSTETWFRYEAQTPGQENLWTTFKRYQGRLQGKRYTRGFVPLTTKGTNDYRERASVAYLLNLFMHPVVRGYFEDNEVDVHEDLYSLSEMLQLIFRLRIRDGHPIKVFVPSERMRRLLKLWMTTPDYVSAIIDQSKIPYSERLEAA